MRQQSTRVGSGTITRCTLVLLFSVVLCVLADAQMVRATLSRLVGISPVIVLGHIGEEKSQRSEISEETIKFDVKEVFKGSARGSIDLCNYHPDSEWPDLSRL